jgi:DNA-directed RNA polymerase specialized sigma24 family protein
LQRPSNKSPKADGIPASTKRILLTVSQDTQSTRGLVYMPNELCRFDFPIPGDEMREILKKAILQLPDQERLVFTLYYYEELTTEEIGLVLGETKSNVSQLHASAMTHLYSQLENLE